MTQFANLPDDCYLLIFVRLSTSTLLSCRRVSRAWLRNQQQVFLQRKVLILLLGNSPTKLLTESYFQSTFITHGIDQNGQPMDFDNFLLHNQVNLRTFNKSVTHFLTENFSNVATLFVVHDYIPSQEVIEPLLDLLQSLSSQVITLKLYFNYRSVPGKSINPNILKVIRQLNSMTELEHVTLESHNPPGLVKVSNNDLEFLTRIRQFYCYSPDISRSWHNTLRRLVLSDSVSQLERIGLGVNKWARGGSFDQWPLANRCTHFPYFGYNNNNMDNSAHFDQSIAHFGSLASFTIDHLWNTQLASKLTTLSNLCPSLVHIKIYVRNHSLFDQPFDPTTIKPVESAKALDLVFIYATHAYYNPAPINLQAQIVPLVHTFPSLVSITIVNSRYLPNREVECEAFFRQFKASLGLESLRTEYHQQSY